MRDRISALTAWWQASWVMNGVFATSCGYENWQFYIMLLIWMDIFIMFIVLFRVFFCNYPFILVFSFFLVLNLPFMSVSRKNVCVVCSNTIKECHKDISCEICKLYVHKKCTNLKTKELKRLNKWKFDKCSEVVNNSDDTEIECESHDVINLNANVNVTDINFDKYDRMFLIP